MQVNPVKDSKLTDAQKARSERNRQHALLLRQSRLANHPYKSGMGNVSDVSDTRLLDTGAGFILEEPTEEPVKNKKGNRDNNLPVYDNPPIFPFEMRMCEECSKSYVQSVLWTQFEVSVCDNCRDEEGKHSYITKTDAKAEYLLKEVDLDQREPLLRFIVRKNPHNPRWGDMKLFLRCQVHERAMEVWGSEEDLQEERNMRQENRERKKIKKFNKTMKDLRMAVRSSTYTKDLTGHVHKYGSEIYVESEDIYKKTCETCGQSVTYEKM